MKFLRNTICLILFIAIAGCSSTSLFSGYRKEVFSVTKITESRTKSIQILNESGNDVQHIIGIAFYANSNEKGNFQVKEARVGTVKVGLNNIFVPPMGVLNLALEYAPLNLESSEASFAGWTTTSESKGSVEDEAETKDSGAVFAMSKLTFSPPLRGGDEGEGEESQVLHPHPSLTPSRGKELRYSSEGEQASKSKDVEPAIHRAMLMIAYDKPKEGYVSIELVGGAEPGPNGEVTAVGGAVGEGDCVAEGTNACFRGTFSIDLPGLMSSGAMEVPISGPIPIKIDGGSAELNMDQFPPILIALVGNGPGQPLEGKPVDAISIIISGTQETVSAGSFDGRNLSLSNVNFRIRVLLGEITLADITPGLTTDVDFNIENLEIITEEPFDGSRIIFGTETTLSSNPSGNGLFDTFLGGARIIVKFSGMLELP